MIPNDMDICLYHGKITFVARTWGSGSRLEVGLQRRTCLERDGAATVSHIATISSLMSFFRLLASRCLPRGLRRVECEYSSGS